MEIHHKHKPWHGLREFLKEYLIVVVGVLTALGAEQAAESLHEHKIADEARESVRAEVRENLWWLERRERHQPCVRQRLTEVGELLDHARQSQPYSPAVQIGLTYHAKLTSLRWETNSQAGRASLFSPVEQRQLGNMYFTTTEFNRAQEVETDTWNRLRAIEGLDHMTPSEISEFRGLLAEARAQNQQIELDLQRAHQWAGLMHLTADNPDAIEVTSGPQGPESCVPITQPMPPRSDR